LTGYKKTVYNGAYQNLTEGRQMKQATIIQYLEKALEESSHYNYDDNIHPSQWATIDGEMLASHVKMLVSIMKTESEE
jgi:hypothetical protein